MAESHYKLSSENNLEANSEVLQNFWDERGVAGNFTGRRGVKIAYRVFAKPEGGPAVVISNGRTESMIKYQEVIYDLYNNGYQIFILDHRGQGFSDREPDLASNSSEAAWQIGDVEKFDHYVDDLKKFVDSVVLPSGPSKLFLLAHSMGGGIASLYLTRHQGDFAAAAMTSPLHRAADTPSWKCFLARAMTFIGQGLRPASKDDVYEKTDPEENKLTQSKKRVNWFNKFTEENEKIRIGSFSLRWGAEACKLADRLPLEAGQIRTKLLILQALNDTIVSKEAHKTFCNAVNEATPGLCHIVEIEKAKHELLVEMDDYRNKAMTEILDHFKD